MSTKEILREVPEQLPPDATLADAVYELEFRQAVEEGGGGTGPGRSCAFGRSPQAHPEMDFIFPMIVNV